MSLWQGVDVAGDACRLVVIDKIPFPRPDDPVSRARSMDVERRGGNGFMSVSLTHAALMMAQGAGRLLRSTTDRGVVAILDPRVVTKRYGILHHALASADVADHGPACRSRRASASEQSRRPVGGEWFSTREKSCKLTIRRPVTCSKGNACSH